MNNDNVSADMSDPPVCRRFEGRTALVTAGAKGLGSGIASRLLREGARVAVWDSDKRAITEIRRTWGERAICIEVDLLDYQALQAAFEETVARLGSVNVLVNNAGGSLHTPQAFLDQTDADWKSVMELNVDVAVQVARLVLPKMIDQAYGRIINLGSKAGRFGSLFAGANYAAAKGAVQSLTLQWAQEYGRHGITCNAICPGAILTERVERLLSERKSPSERADMLKSVPVGRHGNIEDVAAAAAFLASSEAAFITGIMLDVNGGQAMVA